MHTSISGNLYLLQPCVPAMGCCIGLHVQHTTVVRIHLLDSELSSIP